MRYRMLVSTGLALVAGFGLLLFFLLTSRQADVAAVCLLVVHCAGLWVLLWHLVRAQGERRFLWRLLLVTVVLRFSLCVMKAYVWPALRDTLEADSKALTHRGLDAAIGWRMGLGRFELPADLGDLHDWAIVQRSAVLFHFLGYSQLLPESINVVLSASCALAGYVIVRRWVNASAARIAALLIALWPSIMGWSACNLKDPIEMAALSWSVCGLLLLRDRFSVLPVLLVAVSWFTGFLFRPYMGVMIIGGELAAVSFVAIRSRTFLASSLAFALAAVTSVVAVYSTIHEIDSLYGEGTASVKAAEKHSQRFYDNALADRNLPGGRAHSEFVVILRADSTAEALLQLPLRIPLYMLSPIPVRLGSRIMMAAYPEMLFWYWLLPRLFAGLRLMWHRGRAEMIFVLSSLAPFLVSFSLQTSVSGEAMRYRDIFLPELLLFAAVGWSLRRAKHKLAEELEVVPPRTMAELPPQDAA